MSVVLTRYLHHSISVDAKRWQNKTAVELGAGTGIVACALGLLNVPGLDIYSTDLDILLPLARKNVELNGLQDVVKVAALPWWVRPRLGLQTGGHQKTTVRRGWRS